MQKEIIAAIAAYLDEKTTVITDRFENFILEFKAPIAGNYKEYLEKLAAEIVAAIMTIMRPEKQVTPTSELLKQFEATGYAGWINSDAEGDCWIYTREYTQWLEQKVIKSEHDYNNAIIEELSTYETLDSVYDVTELAMLICARVNPA